MTLVHLVALTERGWGPAWMDARITDGAPRRHLPQLAEGRLSFPPIRRRAPCTGQRAS